MHIKPMSYAARLSCAALLMAAGAGHCAVIYNPQTGTLPSAQGWLTVCLPLPSGCSQSIDANQNYLFNTQSQGIGTQGGHGRLDLALNTVSGYQIDWRMQVLAESHTGSNQRAGFSLLAVGGDVNQSIEIGFWNNEVWAYAHDGVNGFTKGTSAAFDTSTGMTDYSLRVQSGGYTLLANGNALFAGLLDNYNASGLLPYLTPNLLFWGDDTSSASASVALRTMQFSALRQELPVPGTLGLAALGMLVLARRKAMRGSSRDERVL